ncbi:hypothetical protein VaNZ11_008754 [Volvox africanus]|uniref:Uncharacterized protein n=1 Tax=Volvox africanus TaxID=51714 RepID=A0ABQ5S649_9CHLO|nr:hypothetical protein VaNZ11_008754 [Volvox africanus]
MDSQQRNENILFTAPSPPAVAEDHARTSQAGAFVASSKRPLLMLPKPNRNERLGAAAAAAFAACGDGGGDDGDASVEPVLAACYPSPDLSTSGANNARLISSILGAMPSLPGSPTLESAVVVREGAPRLPPRSPDAASFHANGMSETFSGGRQTYHRGTNSSIISKSPSDRVLTASRIHDGGGCTAAVYVDAVSVTTLCSMRAMARKSVDAAADAVTLATRQISEISLAAVAAGADEGYNKGAVGAGTVEDRPALPVSTNTTEAAALARARGSWNSSAAPSSSSSLPPPLPPLPPQVSGYAESRSNLPSMAHYQSRHGHSVNAVAPLLPIASPFYTPSSFHVGSDPQSDRPQARCTTAAAGGTYSAPGEEVCRGGGGGGGARSRELELPRRPRWLERLLRAFHADRQFGSGKSTSSEEHSKESSNGGGGDGGGGGGMRKMAACSDDGGKPDGARGDVQYEDHDGGGGDRRDGRGGVGRARSCDVPRDGDEGAGASKTDAPTAITAASGRSTRDQLTRLMNSRLSHRSRSGSEERLLSVTASRDSTTVHRARLAQQARSPRVTTPSINQQCGGGGGVTTRSAGPRYGIVGANDVATALAGKGESGAPVMSTFMAVFPYSASDAATSVTAAASAAAFDFADGTIGPPRIRFSMPSGGMDVHTATATATTTATVAGRRDGRSSVARRLRQLSAPGGPEPQFTPLSQMETHSMGCAEWTDDAAAAVDERESEMINEDLALRVTHRSAAMIFQR